MGMKTATNLFHHVCDCQKKGKHMSLYFTSSFLKENQLRIQTVQNASARVEQKVTFCSKSERGIKVTTEKKGITKCRNPPTECCAFIYT